MAFSEAFVEPIVRRLDRAEKRRVAVRGAIKRKIAALRSDIKEKRTLDLSRDEVIELRKMVKHVN